LVYQVKGKQSDINLTVQSINELVLGGGSGGILPPFSSRGSLDFIRDRPYPATGTSKTSDEHHLCRRESCKLHGWSLPGEGEAKDDCGTIINKGCLEKGKHGGKTYVKRIAVSCKQPLCSVCTGKWRARATHRAVHRFKSLKMTTHRAPLHVIFSPPQDGEMDEMVLRKTMHKMMKKVGLWGGCEAFHPFRCKLGAWNDGPHYHALGYGWIHHTTENYEESGWVVRNLGYRPNTGKTISYFLSHVGIKVSEGKNGKLRASYSLRWFGRMSYNNLKVDPEPEADNFCPYCESPLVFLLWIHTDKPPPLPEDFEGLTDVGDWVEKPSRWNLESVDGPGPELKKYEKARNQNR